MDAKYTLPNISPSAVARMEGKGGGTAQRWYVVWLHVPTTSGFKEQEADETELNNYLQAQEWAVFTGYSSIIIQHLTFYYFLWSMFSSVYYL